MFAYLSLHHDKWLENKEKQELISFKTKTETQFLTFKSIILTRS